MQQLTCTPNVGRFHRRRAGTGAEMPDGYVKMLFEMMLQFFIPTGFIQDGVCFSQMEKKKIIIVVYHSICLCDPVLVLLVLVVGWGE